MRLGPGHLKDQFSKGQYNSGIDAGDPLHPHATNEFSQQIKRVQIYNNQIMVD